MRSWASYCEDEGLDAEELGFACLTGSGEANQEPAPASPTSAEKPTWKPEHFQILSLDGGGLKGIYSAAVLAALEESMGTPTASRFDLIVGTSTGESSGAETSCTPATCGTPTR
jgi:hypothetical protein